MNRNLLGLLVAMLLWAPRGLASELNRLTALDVRESATATEIVVTGTRAPKFAVFRLSQPERLVIDISSADAGAIAGHRPGAGAVSGVVTSQFTDARSSVGRILVGMLEPAPYDVRVKGDSLIVSLSKAKKPSNQRGEEAPRPATRITGLSFSGEALEISADGALAQVEPLELGDPPRLVLDFPGLSLATRPPKVRSALVRDLRAFDHGDKVRVVLDARAALPSHRVEPLPGGLKISLSDPRAAASRAAAVPEAVPEPEVVIDGERLSVSDTRESSPLTAPTAKRVDVLDLTFDESEAGGAISLKLSGEARPRVDRPDAKSAVLTLDGVRLPKRLTRSLDTSALETPVKMISAFPVPGAKDSVRVVVAADQSLDQELTPSPDGWVWRLSTQGAAQSAAKTEAVSVAPRVAGVSSEGARYVQEGTPRRNYSGKKVSFEFKDIDIHNLIRIIAEVSKKNIVVADDVSGKVTIRLRNVPWDQALELILRSKGLGQEDLGNIVRIAPLKQLEEETKLRLEREKAARILEPLVVQLLPVNYATASTMKERVKDVLTDRGTVSVDDRTNVLIVRDTREGIDKARGLIQRLDTATPQVLIESRIVEANTTFARAMGVQWGGGASFSPGTGNPTGLAFPSTVAVSGGSTDEGNKGTADAPNFAVNLPAAVGTGSGGALGFVFGSAGGALALNLRLSALENQGAVKTISAPKITTLDNVAAKISQGVSIPFSQVSASGVNTTFIEARLSLDVTPHITADGSILMTIKAENNQPDPSATGANGQPSIQRKEANTQVLVKDGDTTVIGGIYVRRGANSQALVPFFGRIPILGYLFRNHTEIDTRNELLIFITPRIITTRSSVAQN